MSNLLTTSFNDAKERLLLQHDCRAAVPSPLDVSIRSSSSALVVILRVANLGG
jgi:hypothetical protein